MAVSPEVHILTTKELDEIKHAEYRRGRENLMADIAKEGDHAGCFCPYCNPQPDTQTEE